jgi:lipopolysaccharide export system permease protein
VCDECRSLLRLNLLDRYIFKSVLFTCTAAVTMFAFIVLVPNIAKDLMAYVLAGQIPAATAAKLILLLIPHAVTYALPMGMLTGVLLTLGRLSADSEITAMRAVGIGIARATRPVVILAILAVGIGLYFNFDSMPRTRVEYYRSLAGAIRANPLSLIVPKTFIRDFSGYVVYVGDKQGGLLRDIWIWELDAERRVTRFAHAESGRIDYNEDQNAIIFTPLHVQVETRDPKNPERLVEPQLVVSVEQWEPLHFSLDGVFGRAGSVRYKQEWMTYDQIQAERARLAALPDPTDPAAAHQLARDRMKIDVIFSDKFNTALAVLSLTLMGVPLGIKVSRRETSANFGVAVGLTLAYYLMTVSIKVLDRHPELRPDLLLWLPNLIFIAAGAWLMLRVERR